MGIERQKKSWGLQKDAKRKKKGKARKGRAKEGEAKGGTYKIKTTQRRKPLFPGKWDAFAMNTARSFHVAISSVSSGIFISLQIPVPAVLWYQE